MVLPDPENQIDSHIKEKIGLVENLIIKVEAKSQKNLL
jgi:hypothetical protein